jgi:hypothetical protein
MQNDKRHSGMGAGIAIGELSMLALLAAAWAEDATGEGPHASQPTDQMKERHK